VAPWSDDLTRHLLWQTTLVLSGIVLVFVLLMQFQEAPEVEVVAVPSPGGTYVEGVLGYAETINPILTPIMVPGNPVEQDLGALIFEGLTSLNSRGEVVPRLAREWEVSEDGNTYEFHLRQDVVWHDGAPFSAQDVAFTIQALQDPSYQGVTALAELWRNVTVDVLDRYTVRFVLDEPFPSFLYYTTIGLLPAHLLSNVPAEDLAEHEFSTRRPVGTGMFMVDEVFPDRVVLTASPNWWGVKPYLETIEFWFFAEPEALMASYERQEIHGFHMERPQDLALLTGMDDLNAFSARSAGYGIIYLNLQRESVPFFQEKEVRQALLYALDRGSLIDRVLGGLGFVADSPILPTTWAYEPAVRQYGYDPERAIGLLDAGTWMDSDADRIRDKDGVQLSMTLLTSEDPKMVQMAEEIARQWAAVGVEAGVRPVSSSAIIQLVRARNFDAVLIEMGAVADPDPYPLWHSTQAVEGGQNYSGFTNEEADLLMEEGRATTDPEVRAELYRSFQRVFAEEVPALLIYYPIYSYAVDSEVQGVQLSPMLHASDRFRNLAQWYVETVQVPIHEVDQFDKTGE
jgi:peptide/nickel transport system substrate-binding protein